MIQFTQCLTARTQTKEILDDYCGIMALELDSSPICEYTLMHLTLLVNNPHTQTPLFALLYVHNQRHNSLGNNAGSQVMEFFFYFFFAASAHFTKVLQHKLSIDLDITPRPLISNILELEKRIKAVLHSGENI